MPALFTPNFQRVNASGLPYSGAKLYFYTSGTTTPITVYQDAALSTPHAAPVVADSTGSFAEIFVNTDPFKFVLNTSAGSLIESVDAIPLNAAAALDADLTAIAALSSTGIAVRSASNTWVQRTVTAGTGITVTNGDGVSGNPTVAVDAATAANVRANTANKTLVNDSFQASMAKVTLTDAATITVDMSTFINAKVTLAGNRTLGQPTSVVEGRSGFIEVYQDATGSRTLSYHADWEFAAASAPTLSTAASTKDVLFYQVLESGKIYAALVKAVA